MSVPNHMSSVLPTKTQSGWFLFFFEPLGIGGVIGLVYAGYTAQNPPVNWVNVFGVTVLGLTLLLAGLASVRARRHDTMKQSQFARNRALYPEMPWMWREDWRQGRVQSTTPGSVKSIWVVAIIWSLISSLVLVIVFGSEATTWERAGAILLLAVGVVLLVLAVRQTIRWQKFGKTWFEFATLPGVIGKELRGTIHMNFRQSLEEGVLLKLNCVNLIITGGGRHQITTERILWSEDCTLPPRQVHGGPSGSSIPVAFKIPLDAAETKTENRKNSIHWFLQADAKTPGVDYQDVFEVPVFRTQDSPAMLAEGVSAAPFSTSAPVVLPEKPHDSGIVVKPGESGGTEFDFSAARNSWLAFRATIAFLILTGFIGYCLSIKVELIFLAVFMFLDLVLLGSALFQSLGTSKVVIGSGRVRRQKGLLGFGPTREVPFSDIDSILMPIGSHEESRSGTAYYDLKLQLNNGEQVVLASAIRNKREAEWLIARMKAEIGLKS